MRSIVNTSNRIPAMSDEAIETVRKLTIEVEKLDPVEIKTSHVIHAGMYARTIKVPAGTVVVGALVKVPTILIAQGDVLVYLDGEAIELRGYNVFAASANRKQAVVAITDTYFTMLLSSNAKTVQQAEEQFTDEASLLLSRKDRDHDIIITGE